MDDFDKKILDLIQHDATLSVAEIAEQVGLSSTPCWRRLQNLEKSGVIKGRTAQLDAASLNVGVTVFVMVKTSHHNAEWLERFASAVEAVPEIVDLYRMSGDLDYLMKIVVPSIDGYDAVYKRLIESIELSDVSSAFVMETIKSTTALPLSYL
jgi:Lrp/AsnC family transcriptional regulator